MVIGISATAATVSIVGIVVGATVVVGAAVGVAVIVSEASKETAKTNAEAQKYTADQARIAQVEASKLEADAEKHGYDIDKETEGMILAQDEKEFERELASEREIDAAQESAETPDSDWRATRRWTAGWAGWRRSRRSARRRHRRVRGWRYRRPRREKAHATDRYAGATCRRRWRVRSRRQRITSAGRRSAADRCRYRAGTAKTREPRHYRSQSAGKTEDRKT